MPELRANWSDGSLERSLNDIEFGVQQRNDILPGVWNASTGRSRRVFGSVRLYNLLPLIPDRVYNVKLPVDSH